MELLYVLVSVVMLVFGIGWLIMPFILIYKFNQAIAVLKSIEQQAVLQNYDRTKDRREAERAAAPAGLITE